MVNNFWQNVDAIFWKTFLWLNNCFMLKYYFQYNLSVFKQLWHSDTHNQVKCCTKNGRTDQPQQKLINGQVENLILLTCESFPWLCQIQGSKYRGLGAIYSQILQNTSLKNTCQWKNIHKVTTFGRIGPKTAPVTKMHFELWSHMWSILLGNKYLYVLREKSTYL